MDRAGHARISDFGLSLATNVSDITQELLGATTNLDDPEDPNGLQCWPRGSRVERGGMVLAVNHAPDHLRRGSPHELIEMADVVFDSVSAHAAFMAEVAREMRAESPR